jgi:hypothetical protein
MRQGTPANIRDWEKRNPAAQKFTKTDLAKYEQTWAGMPHLVCRGAEKNFIQLAQRHDNEGEPVVDQNYFKQVIAKMILFKSAERLITAQTGGELRAQTVTYALAWLAEKAGRRIDLNQIWEKQRVPDTLAAAITTVGKEAYGYIKGQPGNPTEAAKKVECWEKFLHTRITLDKAWENSWGEHAFVAPLSDVEALGQEWERIRPKFLKDQRTVIGLAVRLGLEYPNTIAGLIVAHLAALNWEQLKMKPGFGPKKLRQIVELFAAALKNG